MRDNDGRKLDHETLKQVRIRVVRQVERGARPKYLASVLGFALSDSWLLRRSKSVLHRSLTCPFTYAPFSK